MIVDDDGAVVNADFREHAGGAEIRLQRLGEGPDQSRPVRPAVGLERHRDGRTHQRYVGDFNPAGEKRKIAQMRGQLVGDDGGLRAAVIAKRHVGERHGSGRKQ